MTTEELLSTNLAIHGKMGSGKSTVSSVLRSIGMQVVSLADPIKALADYMWRGDRKIAQAFCHKLNPKGILGSNPAYLMLAAVYDRHKDEINGNDKPRAFMQELGDGFRALNQNMFVDHMLDMYAEDAIRGGLVCDDIRFRHEADRLWSHISMDCKKWKMVKLECDEETRMERIRERLGHEPDYRSLVHISEIDLDDYEKFDYHIRTDGPANEIENAVRKGLGLKG